MKHIEVTADDGGRVVINLDKVIYFEAIKHSETRIICVSNRAMIVRTPLDNIIEVLKQTK